MLIPLTAARVCRNYIQSTLAASVNTPVKKDLMFLIVSLATF
jgi:hypothetical protein